MFFNMQGFHKILFSILSNRPLARRAFYNCIGQHPMIIELIIDLIIDLLKPYDIKVKTPFVFKNHS